MNDSTSHWLRMAALSPLLAGVASLDTAIALAAVSFGTSVFTACAKPMLRNHVPDKQRSIAVVLVAAVIATALAMLLQAFCYRIAQSLHDWLPLLAVLPLLLDRSDAALRTSTLQAGAFAAGLLAGAALRSLLPPEAGIAACLIASGLALAIIECIAPSTPPPSDSATKTPRARARVTGPLR